MSDILNWFKDNKTTAAFIAGVLTTIAIKYLLQYNIKMSMFTQTRNLQIDTVLFDYFCNQEGEHLHHSGYIAGWETFINTSNLGLSCVAERNGSEDIDYLYFIVNEKQWIFTSLRFNI